MQSSQKIKRTIILSVFVFAFVQMYHILKGKIGPPPLINGILLYQFLVKKRMWAKIVFGIFCSIEGIICIVSILMAVQNEVQLPNYGVPYVPYLWITDIIALITYIVPFVLEKKGRRQRDG